MSPVRFRRNAIALSLAAGVSLVMAACSERRAADPDMVAEASAPIELIEMTNTVEYLTADPKRLAVVQEGCRTNQSWATEQLCRAAAKARRQRFRGEGVAYTPQRVDPYAVQPMPEASAPPAKRTPQEPAAVPPSGPDL